MDPVGYPDLVLCTDVYKETIRLLATLAFIAALVRWLHRRRKRADSCEPLQRVDGWPLNVITAGWLPFLSLTRTPSSTFGQIFIAFYRFRHYLDPSVAVGLGPD